MHSMTSDMSNKADGFPDPEIPSVDIEGLMVPPWLKYPNIPRRSMGWRMGVGEQYLEEFASWWQKQPREKRNAVKQTYAEPADWAGFFATL
jgi:hypothetical protein